MVGFDNAHRVARQKRGKRQVHRHRLRTIKAYTYHDAATLRATSGARWMWCCGREE
jgi:SHS2 domain-containing protein